MDTHHFAEEGGELAQVGRVQKIGGKYGFFTKSNIAYSTGQAAEGVKEMVLEEKPAAGGGEEEESDDEAIDMEVIYQCCICRFF